MLESEELITKIRHMIKDHEDQLWRISTIGPNGCRVGKNTEADRLERVINGLRDLVSEYEAALERMLDYQMHKHPQPHRMISE